MAANVSVDEGEFPILCETCLGPNPYVRMLEDRAGRECKVCERPFRSHSWRPGGHGMRAKKTEICQTCARTKNVCQTCVLDLVYNLPVAVRDLAIPAGDRQATSAPRSAATREYAAAQADRALDTVAAVYAQPAPADSVAARARRDAPRYERNRSRPCTFFARGLCTRGIYCPYRHENPEEGALPEQRLRDRYYGVDDPVAHRIIQQTCGGTPSALAATGHAPPADKDVRTLFVGGVTADLTEDALRAFIGNVEGASVSLLAARGIGFIDFETREAAEMAMAACYGRRKIGQIAVNFKWGRSSARSGATTRAAPRIEDAPGAKRARTETPLAVRAARPDARREDAVGVDGV